MRVISFGSLNYDISLWVPRHPAPDETLLADRLAEFCGGKGANQAVAAARLGAAVSMVGCVGHDAHGDALLAALASDEIDNSMVARVHEPTGAAFPIITPDNVSIIIARGANGVTGVDHAEAAADALAETDVLLLQGEVNGAGAGRAAELARAGGASVVFNPAPVDTGVIEAVLPHASVVVANEVERSFVNPPPGVPMVVTLGAEGVLVEGEKVPAFPAAVVDPTGAGDAFVAAFAVAFTEGQPLVEAARFGAAGGSLAVGAAGAQPSLPTRAAVEELLRRGPTPS